jgi:four helix bundle protein
MIPVTAITAQGGKTLNIEPVRPDNDLKARTKRFALEILKLYRRLSTTEDARIIGRQLLRSGTSVGANYRAACRARSRAEFIAKLGIVLEESDETMFWLELLLESGTVGRENIETLLRESEQLTSIFVTCLRTAKGVTS